MRKEALYSFGEYRLDASTRVLFRAGQPVSLTPKALDVLSALVIRHGQIVEKEELLKTVWPDTFVEESNLTFQVSTLRKTLGEGYIQTIPKRGYRFEAEVTDIASSIDPQQGTPAVLITQEAPIVRPRFENPWRRRLLLTAALVMGAIAVAWTLRPKPAGPLPVHSLAVLPFQMLRPSAGDELLGLGLTDVLVTRLGRLKQFVVRPTSAVRQFDDPNRDPVGAGRKLSVDAVLDASIQTEGSRIRVNAQLIRIPDGQHLWSETFDLERGSLFALEDQLASRVTRSLLGQAVAGAAYSPKPEAHRLYLLGCYHRLRLTGADERKAIQFFEQAIALDPNYALAYSGLAEAWSLLGYFFGVPPGDAYLKADKYANQALSLDEHLSEAHHVKAAVRLFHDWNWSGAGQSLARALEENPNNPDSHQLTGVIAAMQGRPGDAIQSMQRAVDIDPTSQWRRVGLGFAYTTARRYPEAIDALKKGWELNPNYVVIMSDLFHVCLLAGREAEAIEWSLKSSGGTDAGTVAALRDAYQQGGLRGFLRYRIDRIQQRIRAGQRVSPMAMAQLNAFLGEREEGMRWLEQAYKERVPILLFIKCHPMYDPLRSHPAFPDLLRKIGL